MSFGCRFHTRCHTPPDEKVSRSQLWSVTDTVIWGVNWVAMAGHGPILLVNVVRRLKIIFKPHV